MKKRRQTKQVEDDEDTMAGFLGLEEISADEYFGTKSDKNEKKQIVKANVKKRKTASFQESTQESIQESAIDVKPTVEVKPVIEKSLKNKELKQKTMSDKPIITVKAKKPGKKAAPKVKAQKEPVKPVLNTVVDLPAWKDYGFHEVIMKQLSKLGFTEPTPIQERVFERLLKNGEIDRDVIGEAPTGSGKTLAFGLPILDALLKADNSTLESLSKLTDENRQISALILVPTRELGLQVYEHLYGFVEGTRVRLVPMIGGISVVKQERFLSKRIDVLIATPGRLWSFLSMEKHNLKSRFSSLKWFVMDEVDRMVETGHFKELYNIFDLLKKGASWRMNVYSATILSNTNTSLKELMSRIPFHDDKPLYFQVNTSLPTVAVQTGVSNKVTEFQLPCNDKDLALYQLLNNAKGQRVLVFVNSIHQLKRLAPLFKLLGFPHVDTLHSQMVQRQRLSHLDAFKKDTEAVNVMICTDVLGRGIDIPNVDLVIHYQVPRSKDIYVHRSGRTGRGTQTGTSIVLLDKEDGKESLSFLNGAKLDHYALSKPNPVLRERLTMAKQLDTLLHAQRKEKVTSTMDEKIAEALDIDDLPMKRRVDVEQVDARNTEAHQKLTMIKKLQKALARTAAFDKEEPQSHESNMLSKKYITKDPAALAALIN